MCFFSIISWLDVDAGQSLYDTSCSSQAVEPSCQAQLSNQAVKPCHRHNPIHGKAVEDS